MENASKALLIAGAVLIVILIIGVGMAIYQGSTGTINKATSKMSAQEIEMANQDYAPYIGNSIPGTKVKSLINEINANRVSDDSFSMTWNGTDISKNLVVTNVVASHKYTINITDTDNDGLYDAITATDNNNSNANLDVGL